MFRPVSLYISLRYTRAKRRNRYISFISLASLLGIALSLVVLITVLSVMNGFDQQIRLKIASMVPHVTITRPDDGLMLSDWRGVSSRAKQTPHVIGSAPYVSNQGLITKDHTVHPVMLKGILPADEDNVSVLGHKFVQGSLSELEPGRFGVVLGEELAFNLGVSVGDQITLLTPRAVNTKIGIAPRFKQLTVVGVFKIGAGFNFDSDYAFVNLHDAQSLYGMGDKITGVQLKLTDLFDADGVSYHLENVFGDQYQVSNWSYQYGAFYHAVQMEKTMMFLILLLLVAIAAFNLISGLVMLVNDKQSDIAILRTFGATPRLIMWVFILQGFLVGLMGTLLGLGGGILLALNVTKIVNFIQNVFGVQFLNSSIYFVNYLPSKLQTMDVVNVCVIAMLMSLLATVYPAWRAFKVQPAEALRYE